MFIGSWKTTADRCINSVVCSGFQLSITCLLTEIRGEASISASSKQVQRQVPITIQYARKTRDLVIQASQIKAPTYQGDEVCRLAAKFTQLKNWEASLAFGRGKNPRHQITVKSTTGNMGRVLRLQAEWTEVTNSWNVCTIDERCYSATVTASCSATVTASCSATVIINFGRFWTVVGIRYPIKDYGIISSCDN